MSATVNLGYTPNPNQDTIRFILRECGRVDDLHPLMVELVAMVIVERQLWSVTTNGTAAVSERHLDEAITWIEDEVEKFI